MFYQLHHILYKGDIYATPHTNNSTHFATSSYLVKNLALWPGQVSIALLVEMSSGFGVLEYWSVEKSQNSKIQF
jgi:hypothetical protein